MYCTGFCRTSYDVKRAIQYTRTKPMRNDQICRSSYCYYVAVILLLRPLQICQKRFFPLFYARLALQIIFGHVIKRRILLPLRKVAVIGYMPAASHAAAISVTL